MNKSRRKRLKSISDQLEGLKCEIEELIETEQNAYDNMPESFQQSKTGERMSEITDFLNDATSGIDDTISSINESIQ